MPRIFAKECLELNWHNVYDRCLQFIVSDFFKFYKNQCPDYLNEAFCPADDNQVATRSCNKKMRLPFRRSKLGKQSLSYVGPSTWNKFPNSLKTTTNVNSTAQKIKSSIKDFLSKCYQIRKFLRILSYLLRKSLMKNFISCAVLV